MAEQKEITLKYLEKQLETYLTAKQFAEFKLTRVSDNSMFFGNSNLQREITEYTAQKERCQVAIDELLACIAWLTHLKIIEPATDAA